MRRVRWQGRSVALGAGVGVVLFGLTSVATAAFALGEGTALIMSGTGTSEPSLGYVTGVGNTYIDPARPGLLDQLVFPGHSAIGLTTPEQFWPVTPHLGDMTFGKSVAAGVEILHNAIMQTYAGQSLAVFGYSQSATIVTNEIMALAASGNGPDPSQLGFVMIGNPNTPDGGILERFAGLYVPVLDVLANGATPPDTIYPTAMYSAQYDGISDFPLFPLNLAASLNALLGYFHVHGAYPYTPEGLSVAEQLAVSPDYLANGGVTDYYLIPTQNLPLLEPLREVPYVGQFLAELVQPDLRVLIDLGYGDGYADVPTPASLVALFNPFTVGGYLIQGFVQGWQAALVEAGVLPEALLPDAYPYLPSAHGLSTSLEAALAELFGPGGGLPASDVAPALAEVGPDPAWFASVLDSVG